MVGWENLNVETGQSTFKVKGRDHFGHPFFVPLPCVGGWASTSCKCTSLSLAGMNR
jgi:hypothetical protein